MASRGQVLVTGAGGFTGRYLVDLLSREGWQVVACGYRSGSEARSPSAEGCEHLELDLLDEQAVHSVVADRRPTHVVHLAGLSFPGHPVPGDFYRANLIASVNLLDALVALESPPERVILASSSNVYGASPRAAAGIPESDELRPVNHYGVSKTAMEMAAALFESRLPILIARPFNYTGVGQRTDFVIPKIVSHFRERSPSIMLGNLDSQRDFSDVRSVVGAYIALLERGRAGESYNICSGVGASIREILDTVSAISGHEMVVSVDPGLLRSGDVPKIVGSPAKLADVVDMGRWIPLRETLEWMYSHR